MWDKAKLILRIIGGLILIGVLIVGTIKVIQLYKAYYREVERNLQLEKDFTLATSYGALTELKLRELNNKYEDILSQRNEKITTYIELLSDYNRVTEELRKIKGNIPDTNPGSVPCPPSGECTLETCLPMFIGESIETSYSDYHMGIQISLRRISLEDWDLKTRYTLNQQFKLVLIETTNEETGKKNIQARLTEIDDSGSDMGKLTIKSFKYASIDNTTFGMQWWSPSVMLGLHQPLYSQSDWYPKPFLAFSPSAWARPGHGDLVRFLTLAIGLGTESSVLFLLTPVSYNIGTHIPLLSDLWLGVDIGVDVGARISFGLSLSTTL